MNAATIFAAGVLAGAAIGGSGVYFYLKRDMQQKINEAVDEESDKVRTYYRNKEAEQKAAELSDYVSEVLEENEVVVTRQDKTEYTDILSDEAYLYEEEEFNKPVDKSDVPQEPEEDLKGTLVVSADEWADEDEYPYSKAYVNYFKTDNILADSDDVPIENVKKYIGLELSTADFVDDLLYVVNHDIRTKIEIALNLGTFRDYIEETPGRNAKDPIYRTGS